MKIAVIGGGVSGLTAAGSARGADVVVFEHNEKVGKKIYITGKGRCNFTNACDVPTFLRNVPTNSAFLRSALSRFAPEDAIKLIEDNGCPTKVERGSRAFPQSDKASDVTKALLRYAEANGAEIRLSVDVTDITPKDNAFDVAFDEKTERFDRVIVCTGGKSYPSTGSDGSMYAVAAKLGHNVIPPAPSLVGLKTKEDLSAVEGLTLKNVTIYADGVKPIFGDMMITNGGISGPIVLTLSAYTARRKKPFRVYVDLKPAVDNHDLDARIVRIFGEVKNKQLKNSLDALLPKSIISTIISMSEIPPDKQANSVTRAERAALVDAIKSMPLTVIGDEGFERAVITSGGVDVKQVNPRTMESKILRGLYFGGEVLDVDALTGGFNFHIALATGYAAGSAASDAV